MRRTPLTTTPRRQPVPVAYEASRYTRLPSVGFRELPELIPVVGSQPVGDVSHKPDNRPPLLSARPAVTPGTLKRAATSFAAW